MSHKKILAHILGRGGPLLAALILALALGGVLASCSSGPREARGRLDTPQHHTLRGYDHLDKDDWREAMRSFDLALSLDADYGPAHAGKGVAVALQSQQPTLTADQRKSLASQANDHVTEALGLTKGKADENRRVHVAGIRVLRITKTFDDWLSTAEDYYKRATVRDEREVDPEPHFYMARAYRDAFRINEAIALYQKVLGMNTPLGARADAELAVVQKIQRAAPGSLHGKVIAFEPSITRADIAALFVEELRLDKLYERAGTAKPDTSFRAPGQAAAAAAGLRVAVDVEDHPLRSDILQVINLGVQGLEPDPGGRFNPDAKVTRAEFAMMVEDVLVKVTGEKGIRTKFIGSPSPFRDVRNDVPYFNAVQTVTSRSLMEAENKINGTFGPLSSISGADALLVIRLMKDELRSFLRA